MWVPFCRGETCFIQTVCHCSNVAKIKIIMQTSIAQIKLCKDPCEKLLPDRKLQKLGKKFIHCSNDKNS